MSIQDPTTSVRERLIDPLVGELCPQGTFAGGFVLERVEAGPAVMLHLRAGERGLQVWLRPALGPGRAYKRTRYFSIGYQGSPGKAEFRLLDAICACVAKNEAALFVDGVAREPLPWDEHASPTQRPSAAVQASRRQSEVACTSPWTTMEVTDPDGSIQQCCASWTIGDRGHLAAGSLLENWNGRGFQEARRAMGLAQTAGLCHEICPRLHDRGFAEHKLEVTKGSAIFVQNQEILLEEIAGRCEVLRARPLYLALCPSTYCNYDCIMCTYGRTPRRDLPESIWEQLPELLPTLHTLTLLGGEPLANPSTMRFLREFDGALYPDARVDLITNGSLFTEKALQHLGRCTFGDVTVSLNAGTAAVYDEVQRGVDFAEVIDNLDALLRFRDGHRRPFQVTLSFVVQPANATTLIPFGELARARKLRMRLLPLSPLATGELDFYVDPGAVADVLGHIDHFAAYAAAVAPVWLGEIEGTRRAIVAEAARRPTGQPSLAPSSLPIVR